MGRVVDPETGFQYLQNRYYDPATAQFLTRDPLGEEIGPPYSYVNANPLNWVDQDGLEPEPPKTKRVPSKTIRNRWQKANGRDWPTEDGGRNYDVSHDVPLSSGGGNDLGNITPLPHGDHVQHHKDEGDYKRWGKQGADKKKKDDCEPEEGGDDPPEAPEE